MSVTVRILIIMALVATAGIILRWDYVSGEVASAFEALFRK